MLRVREPGGLLRGEVEQGANIGTGLVPEDQEPGVVRQVEESGAEDRRGGGAVGDWADDRGIYSDVNNQCYII